MFVDFHEYKGGKIMFKDSFNKKLIHLRKEKGITLIALVITIIILLILSGISIATLTGSGLFEKAKLAEQESKNEKEKEEVTLRDYENKIESYLNNTRNSNANYKVLYNNESGASSGVLSESINNFDMLVAIYGSAIAGTGIFNSEIFSLT